MIQVVPGGGAGRGRGGVLISGFGFFVFFGSLTGIRHFELWVFGAFLGKPHRILVFGLQILGFFGGSLCV